MKKFGLLIISFLLSSLFSATFSQTEDDVVINEFVVNPTTGKEYVELLVVSDGVDLRGWTLSDVGTRLGTTGTTEGDFTLPTTASYLQNVPKGTYIVMEFTTPSANSSLLTEDLTLNYPTDRSLIIKTTTTGVSLAGTIDNATNDNLQLYAGSRASGTLIDQVLAGSNTSLIEGVIWGDNNTTTSDNINGGSSLPSGCAVRFVPTDQSSSDGFKDNDSGSKFIVDATSYGSPGVVNDGVDDSGGPLPVELSSFSASVVDNGVKLNWRTETETNNYGFEIQRLQDYKTTKLQDWKTIGFVEGYGNSNSPKDYNYIDASVTSGTYGYRLKQIDNDGTFSYSKIIEVDLGAPTKYELAQNFPNPFNPSTAISFTLPETGNVRLTVFNLLGQEVATLVNEVKEAGTHIINFNAEGLNSGVYIYRIESGSFNEVRKMTLIK